MKPFRFQLEKVLTVREMQSLSAQEALGAAQAARREAQERLAEAAARRRAYVTDLEQRRRTGMPAWEWVITSRRLDQLSREEQAAVERLHAALEAVSLCRGKLAEAKQQEEVLVRLRERHQEVHRQVALLEDQARTDEMAQVVRLVRKGGA